MSKSKIVLGFTFIIYGQRKQEHLKIIFIRTSNHLLEVKQPMLFDCQNAFYTYLL